MKKKIEWNQYLYWVHIHCTTEKRGFVELLRLPLSAVLDCQT